MLAPGSPAQATFVIAKLLNFSPSPVMVQAQGADPTVQTTRTQCENGHDTEAS